MLATGVRICETLAVSWSEVELDRAALEITSTVIRVTGVGCYARRPRAALVSGRWRCRRGRW